MINYNKGTKDNLELFINKIKMNPVLYSEAKSSADICLFMLDKLNFKLSLNELYQIYYGSLIHDIGKTKIPARVLNKNEKLNNDEIEIIQNHPIYGYEMIKDFIQSKIILDIVKYHHERLDGSGYKDGLKEIPFYVQIVSIADMYSAMICKRPYRRALTHEEVMKILRVDATNKKLNMDYVTLLSDYNNESLIFKEIKEIIL